jgi:osmotically-inducible protein OsmY
MRERNLEITYALFLVLGPSALAGIAMQGCNTVQTPREQVSDAQITTQVKSKLAADVNASSLTDINVNTTNGIVTLAGQVETAEVKQHAESVTQSVPGVVRVNNDLQVARKAASTQ